MTPDNDDDSDGRLKCRVAECLGAVEAGPRLYLSAWADGSWTVEGIGDECADITCDSHEHDNYDRARHTAMTAFLETLLPGATWQGADPRHPLGEDTVTLQITDTVLASLRNLVPELLQEAVIIKQGAIL